MHWHVLSHFTLKWFAYWWTLENRGCVFNTLLSPIWPSFHPCNSYFMSLIICIKWGGGCQYITGLTHKHNHRHIHTCGHQWVFKSSTCMSLDCSTERTKTPMQTWGIGHPFVWGWYADCQATVWGWQRSKANLICGEWVKTWKRCVWSFKDGRPHWFLCHGLVEQRVRMHKLRTGKHPTRANVFIICGPSGNPNLGSVEFSASWTRKDHVWPLSQTKVQKSPHDW